ncbi:prepilin-type N-terminal cleavage/methylation domain-containing protein [Peribacillus deserti]|uniref:ComG operon protein 3 n=1 Tax=Peribacillus deserti TaxID=673318 RepID=A0ABS2QJE6_9BACI|nr:competence type IV pilus major pilin ComGC [Peribacillus deserti]MBM7693286.1 prepilin-type N-terminal cleavage/methylation domain-containing protein [Peribacillus deserti]
MNEKGFTLIEMMIVLLIISVLLIITIPNITKNQTTVRSKGCQAFLKMVDAQIQSYELDNNAPPSDIDVLVTEKYLKQKSCPDGTAVIIGANGEATEAPAEDES